MSFSEKFRKLLENLWACVDPQQLHTEKHLLFPGETHHHLYFISILSDSDSLHLCFHHCFCYRAHRQTHSTFLSAKITASSSEQSITSSLPLDKKTIACGGSGFCLAEVKWQPSKVKLCGWNDSQHTSTTPAVKNLKKTGRQPKEEHKVVRGAQTWRGICRSVHLRCAFWGNKNLV